MATEPVPGGDSGYAVDLPLLSGVAGQIQDVGEEFDTAIAQYGQGPDDASAFGSEVAGAWSGFNGAWAQELNVTGLAHSELLSKITNAGTRYAGTESANSGVIDRIME